MERNRRYDQVGSILCSSGWGRAKNERQLKDSLAKFEVAGPNPDSRSKKYMGHVKFLALI
jgi:hypothetical protein